MVLFSSLLRFLKHSFHQRCGATSAGATPLLLSHGMDFFGLRSLSNLPQGLCKMLLLVLFIFVRIFIGTVHMISQLMGGGGAGDGAGDDSGRRGGQGTAARTRAAIRYRTARGVRVREQPLRVVLGFTYKRLTSHRVPKM